jgi:hypothetical protein
MTCKCGISIPWGWGLYAAGNGALWAMIPTGQSCKQLCHVNTERRALPRHLHCYVMLTTPWLRVDWLYSNYAVDSVGQTISKTIQLGNLRCGRFVWRQFYNRCRGSSNDTGCTAHTAEPARANVLTCTVLNSREGVSEWVIEWLGEWVNFLTPP